MIVEALQNRTNKTKKVLFVLYYIYLFILFIYICLHAHIPIRMHAYTHSVVYSIYYNI